MVTRLLAVLFFAAVLGAQNQTQFTMFFFSASETLFRERLEEEKNQAAKIGDSFSVFRANQLLTHGDPTGYGEFVAELQIKLEAWRNAELNKGMSGAFCGRILSLGIAPFDNKEGAVSVFLLIGNARGKKPSPHTKIVFIKSGVDQAFKTITEMVTGDSPTKVEPPKIFVPSKSVAQNEAQPPKEGALFAYLLNILLVSRMFRRY